MFMDEKLLNLIEKGESETVEFKKSTAQLEKALKAICGFLNHRGGVVYFGIDNGRLAGQEVSDSTLKSISQKIRQRIKPEISPEIRVIEIEGRKIVDVEIKEGNNKPYYLNGIAYKRVGSESPLIPPEELERIILANKKRYFDSQICEGAGLNNIDEEKVRWFLRKAKKKRGLTIPEDTPAKEALMKLKLLQDKKPTNTAMLLFAKEPWFLQSEVKCIRFSGNEPVKPYIDFQTYEGNIFDLVNKAEDFVFRNIRKSIWLVPEQVQREEKYEYPPDAIREAIVNAVIHRDWESPSKVHVRVFDNRIEVWSPGLLPPEITIEDLRRDHRSIPRNPLLFKQLFWVKYVEDVGGGTIDMINGCRLWGIPEPEFKYITGAFVVVFKLAPTFECLDELGLNERQVKAVDYVVKKRFINNKKYQAINQTSRYTASRDLMDLVKKNVFKSTGTGKRDLKYVLMHDAAKMRQKMRQNGDRNE